MRFLTLNEVLDIHRRLIDLFGGTMGIRDLGALESAIAQPRMTFGGEDLYPSIAEKTAALGYSIIKNHPFVDGNKRVGHAAMEIYLVLNGHEIKSSTAEQEDIILQVASGELKRDKFEEWLKVHLLER